MANSIGTFQFDIMEVNPDLRGDQPQLFSQIGVDGWGMQRTGKRGDPFEVETRHFQQTFATAKAAYELYKAAVAGDPLELIWNDLSYGTFLIRSVTQQDLFAVESVIGSIETNPKAEQIMRWSLVG